MDEKAKQEIEMERKRGLLALLIGLALGTSIGTSMPSWVGLVGAAIFVPLQVYDFLLMRKMRRLEVAQ